MQRDLNALTRRSYDLLVVGGGIYGACVAWDAVLRGFSVALIEREDFGSGASANSFKMVHGGIRYLQHADLPRLRASCFERSALLRIAPHLVTPLPIVVPTYGHGAKGKLLLGTGMLLYDALTADRNRGIRDPSRRIPLSRFLSRDALLDLFPDLDTRALTGGALFHDGQMYNPTRLVLAFIRSAVESGAQVANYVEATSLRRTGRRVTGVEAKDVLTGEPLTLEARLVINTAGPWAECLLQTDTATATQRSSYSRDACFLIPRRYHGPHALALTGRTRDPDALLSRPARHLFLVPWRDHTLVGVWHRIWPEHPDTVSVTDKDLEQFIDEINWAHPALGITPEQVTMWNAGLVPFGENRHDAIHLSYGKRSRFIDHARRDGIEGMVTLIGIRYTMARGDASRMMDHISRRLGRNSSRPPTERLPVHGGEIHDFERLVNERQRTLPFPEAVVRALLHNYGTDHEEVIAPLIQSSVQDDTLGTSSVLHAEVTHAIRREMAMSLADIVFRRTDLATGGHPGRSALEECASLAAAELGWSSREVERQVSTVLARFPAHPVAASSSPMGVKTIA